MTCLTTTFVIVGVILIGGIWGSTSPGDSALEATLMEMKELMIDLRDRVDKQDSKILELTRKSKEQQISEPLSPSDIKPASLLKRAKTGDKPSGTDSRCFPYPGLYTSVCRQGKQGARGRDGRDGRDGPPGKDGLTPEQLQKVLENILKFKEKADEGKVTRRNDSGAVYVRWGRTKCPDHSELVYKGWAGGSWFKHPGGGSTKLCLPEDPQYLKTTAGFQGANYLHGAEYQLMGVYTDLLSVKHARGHSLQDADVPCAVCLATSRPSIVMIPAKWECNEGWTREYYGYLMTEKHSHFRSSFDCVDIAPEVRNGGKADKDGALFYFVEGYCGHSLPCPPYQHGKELTCAVCTR